MNNPSLYASSNARQKRDAIVALHQYVPQMVWSDEDVILDVGSGPGDVTRNILIPHFPAFQGIVGVDKAAEMVDYAIKNFAHEKISYRVMDIEAATQPRQVFPDGFTKVFSLYCLHWIKNMSAALNNIYQLLRPGGSCLLIFLSRHPVINVYGTLARNDKWSKYMQDFKQLIPVNQDTTNPHVPFRAMMEECGFNVLECIAPEFTYAYENVNDMRNAMKAVNPFITRIPADQQEEYMDDVLMELQKITPIQNGKMVAQYNLMIVHGEKPQ